MLVCLGVLILAAAEKTFENKIKKFLDDQKCWHVKFFANGFTKKGVPDILASVNGYFVGIEVKSATGHPSNLQMHHVSMIRESGGFAFVVYPSGFEELKKIITDLKKDTFREDLPMILK